MNATLGRRVGRTRRALHLARALEGLLLGAAALFLVLAVAALLGAALDAAALRASAALVGLAVAGAWWWTHRRTPTQVASSLDRALARDGSLLTAWEAESAPSASGLGSLLVVRERSALGGRSGSRTLLPSPLAAGAVALLAAALLTSVLELGPGRESPAPERAGGATTWLAGTGGPVDTGDLATELDRLEALAGEPSAGPIGGPNAGSVAADAATEGELLEEVRSLVRELEHRSAGLGRGSAELDQARRLAQRADALRRRLEGAGAAGERGPPGTDLTAAGPERTMSGRSSSAADSAQASAPPPTGGESPVGGPAPVARASEEGTLAGRWWPARHDDVVARWIEAERRRRAERER